MNQALRTRRLADFAAVGAVLAPLGDRRLGQLVAGADPLGAGIGGRSGELDVGGRRVFVKRIPLTELELRPSHARSTANLFGLPLFYQYGIGSAGFGAWRELATHTLTTRWVLDDADAYQGFPLMYHWRVLPGSAPDGFVDGFGGIDKAVSHWDGSPAVRRRLEALGASTAELVLFLEHVPHTLGGWLAERRHGADGEPSPYPWVVDALTRGADFMSARGLVHFDAHFRNVLTDGRLIYFADFGLALSSGFELAPPEADFHARHRLYDRFYTTTHLIRHHLFDDERDDARHVRFLRAWTAGRRPEGVRDDVGALLDRYARSALVLEEFQGRLLGESRRTVFPADEIERALS
ncbi:protein kinase family protein [Streptomyces sp. NBC_01498]|uniref:protein kinase family protein n=1 Tax=Streptomyces sp. NBC_01498 TaxID=2975870 RepID=UPI002E7BA84E|nr:protein kinase family protein [Streptomyces sp. NBC_01498]WTL25047.1 protein kinase family protein [Streptomyces sp. NBC_01498]